MRYEIIPFQKQQIGAVQINGEVYVIMKPVAEALGLDWSSQYKRIQRHPVLSEGISVTEIPSGGGAQEMVTLELEKFHGWLATISVDRITDPEKREAIVRYQREAFRAIFEHFHGPMKSQAKMPPTRELIALTRERQALLLRLSRTKDDLMRREIYGDLVRITTRLGGNMTPLEDFDAAVRRRSGATATEFFAALNELDRQGLAWNVHRRPDQYLAVNFAIVQKAFEAAGIDMELTPHLREALKLAPSFLREGPYQGTRHVRCMLFKRPSRPALLQ